MADPPGDPIPAAPPGAADALTRRRLLGRTLGWAAGLAALGGTATWGIGRELRGWGLAPRADWSLPLAPPVPVAHRGGAGLFPENTLEAYRAVVQRFDVPFLELDVRCTRDGVPVVIHDATVERTTDGRGAVRDYELAALLRLDAGFLQIGLCLFQMQARPGFVDLPVQKIKQLG